MRLVAGGVRLATLAALIALSACPMQRESGGRKDMATRDASLPAHHVAGGFRNPVPIPRPGIDVTLPFFVRRAAGFVRSRRGAPPLVATDMAFLRENAKHSTPTVTWIGHATVLVQMDHVTILTDPIWSATASPLAWLGPRRFVPPPLALDALPPIDFVLISHNHYDHLDDASVRALDAQAGGPPLFIVPLGNKAWMAERDITNVIELDWWQSHTVGMTEIVLTPVQHWSGRALNDRLKTLWGGYAVFAPDLHLFFTGDTAYSKDFADIRERFRAREADGGGFDLALIAIGAYEPRWFMTTQHVNPAEAVQIHLDVNAKRSVGIHWGTFELTDESLDQPPKDLIDARHAKGLADDAFTVMAIGETQRIPRRAP